jgi:polyferredoxin
MGVSLAVRIPFKVDVVRDRAVMAREVEGGMIENVYRLQLMNATESAQPFHVGVSGWPGLEIADKSDFTVDAAQSRWVVLHVRSPGDASRTGSHPIHFEIESLKGLGKLSEKSAFLTPR